ncbi:MAG: hypothetical protein CH6_0819 [Candidatus Kapaibacterium sp.]|nr:MAG: hypothetical protein CH6_0819 [Candidatus Kapabacteria bacterium]
MNLVLTDVALHLQFVEIFSKNRTNANAIEVRMFPSLHILPFLILFVKQE